MTIDEINFFWECDYRMECMYRGIKLQEPEIGYEEAKNTYDSLQSLYGDI